MIPFRVSPLALAAAVSLAAACGGRTPTAPTTSSSNLPLVHETADMRYFHETGDTMLSYRMAGSFVLHLTERFGLPAVLRFFQTNNRDESLDAIQARMRAAFGVSLEEAESSWLAMLRS